MPTEQFRSGLEYLVAMTSLLQRIRSVHPTKGLYQAAELQWWWGVPRSTDDLNQLFWFDDDGRPEAAVIVTDFGNATSALYASPMLVVSTMPDASAGWIAHVFERGLAHVAGYGIESVELEVEHGDEVMRAILAERGFAVAGDGLVQCWLDASVRLEVSEIRDDYRLFSRAETKRFPHHMVDSRRPDIEERLCQTSLYRSDLDLVVVDSDDVPAAYGLFWFDPETATGVVEPMRTQDEHQQRGLARHVLTAGVQRLVDAGAERISIGYESGNPASGHLYRSVGFVPHAQTDLFSGPVTSRS